ncbi:MAG: glycosyltransferase [Actinomycetota bacterium]|nr:glycosyltransferase [Actinomycetota bacterium]
MRIKQKILDDVSFITTVFNEEESITGFMESLMEQSCLPREIVIVDGGSRDGTLRKISGFLKKIGLNEKNAGETGHSKSGDIKIDGWLELGDSGVNIKVIEKKGANISQGRNEAIKASSGRIICASDAGCVLDKNWMVEITKFYSSSSAGVAGGLSSPYCRNFIGKCLAVCVMPLKEEINPGRYMPSSRNISFTRKAWVDAGGYPEDMDYGEDMKFNFNIKSKGYRIKFNPDAVVLWKMRENPARIFLQFFRYAKGDAEGKMYPQRHVIRFSAFLGAVLIILGAIFLSSWILFAFVPFFIYYIYKPYRRLIKSFINKDDCSFLGMEKLLSIIFIPILLLHIDLSKMCGYIRGLIKL